MLLCGIYATIPPSFCFAKIHLSPRGEASSGDAELVATVGAAICRPLGFIPRSGISHLPQANSSHCVSNISHRRQAVYHSSPKAMSMNTPLRLAYGEPPLPKGRGKVR